MTDDQSDPSNTPSEDGSPFASAQVDSSDDLAGNAIRRPHPLDDDADDWAPPKSSFFTIRNVIAIAITLFVSLLLAILVGLPYSPGAAIGVFLATALLFGPLWFALTHQPYDERIKRLQSTSTEKKDEAGSPDSPLEASTAPANHSLNPQADNQGAASQGIGNHAMGDQPMIGSGTASNPLVAAVAAVQTSRETGVPARQPLAAFYQPLQRVRQNEQIPLPIQGYVIVAVFGVFAASLLLCAPFIANMMLQLWG